nr:MAG: D12 class N6 adenine-specific DNA methyltransferase [Bacteriophage sp.]
MIRIDQNIKEVYLMEYVKSPLNYTGGKYKLLPQLLELFPKQVNTFVDLFAGGGECVRKC